MAITPINASLTNTTAGTRTQIVSDTDIKPTSVYVEALGSNTGFIYLGLVTVSSTVYIARLSAGQGFTIQSDGIGGRGRLGGVGIQLSSLYIDSAVNGEKVLVTYQYPIGG